MANSNVANIYLLDDDEFTARASGAVVGATFVAAASGGVGNKPNVATCAAGARALGVAGRDTASGADVLVYADGVIGVTAGAALTAGQVVQSDAAGKAIVLASGIALGVVMADTASGAQAPIKLAGLS